MGMLVGGFADVGLDAGGEFSPTIEGDYLERVGGAAVVEAFSEELLGGNTSTTTIWVDATASDIEIRCQGLANGSDPASSQTWYDETGVDQGDPDTNRTPGTRIFFLGEKTGVTVNIYTSSVTLTPSGDPGASRTKLGTFTDDDKTSFFTPVTATEYGYELKCRATSGTQSASGGQNLQFTFRKAGYTDYTITFQSEGSADYLTE